MVSYVVCVAAMDFLTQHAKVDLKNVGVWGGSQGGGLTFMTASLDRRVTVCIADVPWLCSWKNYFETSHWDEIDDWIAADTNRNWNKMLRTLSYFDTMNMTERITCPVLMGVGLQDAVCPPATSFASYNNIKSRKQYVVYTTKGHNIWPEHEEFAFPWIRKHLGLE